MGVRSRSKRRRKAMTPAVAPSAAGADDLISGLADDVLLHILGLLDATDAARTVALSRRWHSLWLRIPVLTFSFDSSRGRTKKKKKTPSDAARFVDVVNGHLSLRAAARTAGVMERLSILYDVSYPLLLDHDADAPSPSGAEAERVVSSAVGAAQGWVRHALRHAVKSFLLELHLPWGHIFRDDEVILLHDDLLPAPSAANKLETMHLALSNVPVQLPSTSAPSFSSLTDVSLECMALAPGSAPLLAHLLSSSCCPRLQKLRLRRLAGLNELLLDASELKELSFEEMENGCSLELRTPSLRVLRMLDDCHGNRTDMLTISAPRLKEIRFLKEQPGRIVVHGELPFVESLKVDLRMYRDTGRDDRANDVGVRLLQCCTSAASLEVSLQARKVVDIISGTIPSLPHVTSLTVHHHIYELHAFGFGLEHILKQCRNLKYLRVHCPVTVDSGLKTFTSCDHPDRWKFREVSLSHLEEVEFVGLAGIDCELWFVQLVLRSTAQLHKATVSFSLEYMRKRRGDASELISKLGGLWTVCHDTLLTYEWKPSLYK